MKVILLLMVLVFVLALFQRVDTLALGFWKTNSCGIVPYSYGTCDQFLTESSLMWPCISLID